MALGASSILGQAETDFSKAAGVDRVAADKNTFLKLLVAQLTHQDPLNPAEDKEFIAQLAQFTSLELLQGINEGVGVLNTSMVQGQLINATSFIGKEILSAGSELAKYDNYCSTVYFTLDESIAKGQVNIFDKNGNLVRSNAINASNAGDYQFDWDGKNNNGETVPNGVYSVIISAQDANDKVVMPTTEVSGRVTGVQTEDGVHSLRLFDGRLVKFTDITDVREQVLADQDDSASAGDGSSTGGGSSTTE